MAGSNYFACVAHKHVNEAKRCIVRKRYVETRGDMDDEM